MSTETSAISLRPASPLSSYVFLVVLLGGALFAVSLRPARETTGYYPFAVLCLVQLFPFLLSLARGRCSLLGLVGLSHFLNYSCGKYNQVFLIDQQSVFDDASIHAFHELTICYLIVICVYGVARAWVLPTVDSRQFRGRLEVQRYEIVLVALFLCGMPFADKVLPLPVLSLTGPLTSAAMVFLLSVDSASKRYLLYCRILVVLVAGFVFIHTGFLGSLGELAGDLFLISVLEKRYGNLVFLLIGALFGTMLQSVKGEYRKVVWANPDIAFDDRVALIGGLLADRFLGDGGLFRDADTIQDQGEDKGDLLVKALGRVGDDSVERVLAMTPGQVPFWNGSTYSSILYLFVPRAIWPNKPQRTLWHAFALAYNYLSEDDDQTSISLNYWAEGYMNFGYFGMYCIALFFGLLLAAVEWGAYWLLSGYNLFCLVLLTLSVYSYATDLGTVVASFTMTFLILLVARRRLMLLRVAATSA